MFLIYACTKIFGVEKIDCGLRNFEHKINSFCYSPAIVHIYRLCAKIKRSLQKNHNETMFVIIFITLLSYQNSFRTCHGVYEIYDKKQSRGFNALLNKEIMYAWYTCFLPRYWINHAKCFHSPWWFFYLVYASPTIHPKILSLVISTTIF